MEIPKKQDADLTLFFSSSKSVFGVWLGFEINTYRRSFIRFIVLRRIKTNISLEMD